jgi:hypothetical protein
MWFLGCSCLALALLLALHFDPTEPLGALLFRADPAALGAAQAGIQRYLAPWLWDDVVLRVIERPAWVLPAALGAILLLLRGMFGRA